MSLATPWPTRAAYADACDEAGIEPLPVKDLAALAEARTMLALFDALAELLTARRSDCYAPCARV